MQIFYIIKIGEKIKTRSDKPDFWNLLASAYNDLASLQKDQRKYQSAIKNCKKAIEIVDKIKETNLDYFVDWMVSKNLLADLYIATDHPNEAREIVNEIKPIAEKLLKEYPKNDHLQNTNEWIKETESMLNQ